MPHAQCTKWSEHCLADSSPEWALKRQKFLRTKNQKQGFDSADAVNARFQAVANQDDEITKQVERAKALLEKSKAKMQAKEKELEASSPKNGAKIPFFASKEKSNGNKKEKVTKTENEEGLITTDGEMMAKLSEAEEWEVRGLLDVFENEQKDSTPDPFADRDVAGSIFNLRKTLQTEDFQKIFDKRNRFIGEN